MDDRQLLLDRITVDPEMKRGKPCIRGMRISVYNVLGWLAYGMSQEQILDEHPSLEPDDIRAALLFAATIEDRVASASA